MIVIGHTAHPGTAELVGFAIRTAAAKVGAPEGVFSLLFSADYEVGQELVRDPVIRAVGFTGSRTGGRALMDIAASRNEPIPVYAEMSSVNPIFVLPGALEERGDEISKGLHASVTLGSGQFCTKPGMVFVPDGNRRFEEQISALTEETQSPPLLTDGIRNAFEQGVKVRDDTSEKIAASSTSGDGYGVNASVFKTDIESFLEDRRFSDEVFGPTTLLVASDRKEDMIRGAREMEGQLTATIHGTPEDLEEYHELVSILESKVGRVIFNGYPTGVEVNDSIVHGGCYPATSDSRTSSVGTRAIRRFSRFVCYQDFPEGSLPAELRDNNPLGISRIIDGKLAS